MAGLVPPQLSAQEQQRRAVEHIADRLRSMELTRLARVDEHGSSIADRVYQACCRLTEHPVPRLGEAGIGDQWLVIAREHLSEHPDSASELLSGEIRALKAVL